MKFTQIRNATIKIKYAGKTFLFDPFLADKGSVPGYPATINSHIDNPTIALPMLISDIFKDVDAVIVTHTHPDH
jgi:L-ascorbate metabolism protein UlaG (beta-lactamase superfamily)